MTKQIQPNQKVTLDGARNGDMRFVFYHEPSTRNQRGGYIGSTNMGNSMLNLSGLVNNTSKLASKFIKK